MRLHLSSSSYGRTHQLNISRWRCTNVPTLNADTSLRKKREKNLHLVFIRINEQMTCIFNIQIYCLIRVNAYCNLNLSLNHAKLIQFSVTSSISKYFAFTGDKWRNHMAKWSINHSSSKKYNVYISKILRFKDI